MLPYLFSTEELSKILSRMGYDVSGDQLHRSVNYYFERTAHDSSLSDLVYAGALASFAPDRSWQLYRSGIDPDGEEGHSGGEKGIHLGAMASTMDVLQRHYLGIRPCEAGLAIDPVLPQGVPPIRLSLVFRAQKLTIRFDGEGLRLESDPANGTIVPIVFRGRRMELHPGVGMSLDPQTRSSFAARRDAAQ